MSAAEQLQATIRRSIPLSEAMQFSIEALDIDAICVSAPLEPNINIHGTGFAGSIYAVAVLTGWALCTHIIERLGLDAELVVGSAEIRYRSPVRGRLECRCECSEAQRDAFLAAMQTSGKGRLVLDVSVGDAPQARLQGTYHAIAR